MQQYERIFENDKIDDDLEPWKRLENVIRTWAVLSSHEKSLEKYENLKNQHG